MIVLGLTGSIGMGKSTTAQIFRDMGVKVHDADAAVHQLYNTPSVAAMIEAAFPNTTNADAVDRRKLSNIVFDNPIKLKQLETLIHPRVRDAESIFLNESRKQGEKLVVLDIPLLFETGGEERVDKILVVTAPYSVQKDRVLQRPGMTVSRFEEIVKKQMPDHEKQTRADFIIDTSYGLDHARKSVAKIINELST